MKCEDYQGLLQDYVTRQLDPARRRLVDAHLLECADCQRELAVLTALVSALDHQPVSEPSAAFAEKVLANLPRQRAFVPSPWWALALAPVLATLAFLFRTPVASALSRLLDRLPNVPVQLPSFTASQVALFVAVALGFGLLVSAGAAYWCWQVWLRD
jgi:anti-sigma factor RsiW